MPFLMKISVNATILFILASVTGCGEHNKGVNDANAATPGNGNASYELVTVSRPVSLEKEFAPLRATYDVCVGAAELNHLPYKPFPEIPKDYVISRHTWISDGERYLEREEQSVPDVSKTLPENGCEVRLGNAMHESRVQDGKSQEGDLDMNGEYAMSQASDYYPAELDKTKLALFKTKRTVNGVSLVCTPPMPGSGPNDPGFCTIDPAVAKGVLATAAGEPLPAYYIMHNTGLQQHDVIVEPVKFNTGRAIPLSAFKLGKK